MKIKENVENPVKQFMKLLSKEGRVKYHLRINKKYASNMSYMFWCALSRGYKYEFVDDLENDILYEMEEIQ